MFKKLSITSCVFLFALSASAADPVQFSKYSCAKDAKDLNFGRIECSKYAALVESTLSEGISGYIYGYMKGEGLGYDGKGLCKMKYKDGSFVKVKAPLCMPSDIQAGANKFGQKCGGGCQYDDRGIIEKTCEAEKSLNRGAILSIALHEMQASVQKVSSDRLDMKVSDGKVVCEVFFKELKEAREKLDKLEKQTIEKFKIPAETVTTEALTKACSEKGDSANNKLALCGIVNAEKLIQSFGIRLLQCEMYAAIQDEQVKYKYGTVKNFDAAVAQREEVCEAVNAANTQEIDVGDDDEDEIEGVTEQECYTSGKGYDNKGLAQWSDSYFKQAYPYDSKYLSLIKAASPALDAEMGKVLPCGK